MRNLHSLLLSEVCGTVTSSRNYCNPLPYQALVVFYQRLELLLVCCLVVMNYERRQCRVYLLFSLQATVRSYYGVDPTK